MIISLSEEKDGIAVRIFVEISQQGESQILQHHAPFSEIEDMQGEALDRSLGQTHNQLLPMLRQARLIAAANLVESFSSNAKSKLK